MSTIKKVLHFLLMNQVECRPRLWVRLFRPFYTNCALSSKIYFSARMDVVPFSRFVLGKRSVVESYSCINNAVGNVIIGTRTRIGLGNTIIGPVRIGDDVNLAQSVVVTALNHKFEAPNIPISQQGIITKEVIIEDDVWIGANSTILPGVHIGSHVVIGAGSVVTHDIPPHSLAIGIPARVVRNI